MECVAQLPFGSRQILIDLINARDRWVIQGRGD